MAHDLDAFARCEREAEAHVAAGRTDVAAGLYERALRLRIQIFGAGHPVVLKVAEVFARISNHASNVELRSTGAHWQFERAEQRLGRTLELLAEVAVESHHDKLPSLFNLTLGNMAALHRRRNENEAALRWLLEADALATMLPASEVVANNLSLCSILSKLGRHAEAERHAAEAVRLSESDIFALASLRKDTVDEGLDILRDKVSALAVAYNNLAVQREFLGNIGECLALYEKAVVLAEGHLQQENPLLAKLRASHRNALQLHAERRYSSLAGVSSQHKQRISSGADSPNACKPQGIQEHRPKLRTHGHGMAQQLSAVARAPLSGVRPNSAASSASARSNDQHGKGIRSPLPQQNCALSTSAVSNPTSLSAPKMVADPSGPLPYHMKRALRQMKAVEADNNDPDFTRCLSSSSTASQMDSADADDGVDESFKSRGKQGRYATLASNAAVTQVLAEALRSPSHPVSLGCGLEEVRGEKTQSQSSEQVSELSTGSHDNSSSERDRTIAGPQRALRRARQEAAAIRIQRAYKRYYMFVRRSPSSENFVKPTGDLSRHVADSPAPEPTHQEPLPRPMSRSVSMPLNAFPRLSLSLGRNDAGNLGQPRPKAVSSFFFASESSTAQAVSAIDGSSAPSEPCSPCYWSS